MSAGQILSNLAVYSLQIVLLVAVAAFVPRVLRLRLPDAKLAYWHMLLAACFLLPIARPWTQQTINVGTVLPGLAAPAPAQSVPIPAPAAPGFTLGEIALAALAAGALARLAWLAVGFWRLRQYRRHSLPLEGAARFGGAGAFARQSVDLRLSEDVSSPVTFGFRKPVILLPAGFPQLDAPIQDAVLIHERLHVRRRDWLFTVIEEVIRAALWFHPAIWWLLGEVQLTREQAVDRETVETTRNREEYVDALLAIAGAQPRLDLAPAPLFLRKRHLKQRVKSILKEVRMSKTQSLSALAAGVCILAAACWLVAGAFPLAAAPQVVADGPGVSVDLGGAALIHRPPVWYPEAARAGRVEGTVVVEVTLDSAGNPVDASVLSGPQELRKAALQSVLQWHFTHGSGATRQVSIAFQVPAEGSQPAAPASIAPAAPSRPAAAQAAPAAAAPAASQTPDAAAEISALEEQMRPLVAQLNEASARRDRQAMDNIGGQISALMTRMQDMQKITAFKTFGLSEQASNELLGSLPVHAGDAATGENLNRLRDAVKQFDEHLNVVFAIAATPAEVAVHISAPDSETPRIMVGAKVQEANLVRKVLPAYPPDARSARIQGAVVLKAVIGKDGAVQELAAVSGHPMLVQAAMDAVKQWQYKPTLLNGQPVEVTTEVSINFTLASGPIPPAQ